MNAIAAACKEHVALLAEYREMLREWTRVRALPSDEQSPVGIAEISAHLEEIERKLKNHRTEHGC
jgi:hypothetical protein